MLPEHRSTLERIADEYRAAFEAVQQLLVGLDLGKLPPYVFAIDRFDIDALREMDAELGDAEQRRRQWRAALHATAELASLDTLPTEPSMSAFDTFDPDDPDAHLASLAGSDMDSLDRFISVVQHARSVGCMYVDGGFEPVLKRDPS